MKPGVLPDSGNHINFAPTLAEDGGGTTFNNFSQILEIYLTAKIMIFFSSWIYSARKIKRRKDLVSQNPNSKLEWRNPFLDYFIANWEASLLPSFHFLIWERINPCYDVRPEHLHLHPGQHGAEVLAAPGASHHHRECRRLHHALQSPAVHDIRHWTGGQQGALQTMCYLQSKNSHNIYLYIVINQVCEFNCSFITGEVNVG